MTLGFGIVGAGMIADFHARAIAQTEGARLIGVASRNADVARAFAVRHGAAVLTTTLRDLLANPGVDVICVTTPSGAHREPALAAIRAGKHVVIEKPLEITTERADDILAEAAAAGVLVAPIFQARFGSGAQALKTAVDGGRFGRIALASAYVKWHRGADYYRGWKGTLSLDGGGALINQAIHAVDLLQWFAGMPREVFSWKTRTVHVGIEAEDTLVSALRFESGALGTIEASTAMWPGWQRRIELGGEHGSVVLEDDAIARWDFREACPGDEALKATNATGALGSGAGAANAISVEGHRRQIQNLIDAVRSGDPLAVDGHEARKALVLVRAIYASAESGSPVGVPR